jgi:hypothetical protein
LCRYKLLFRRVGIGREEQKRTNEADLATPEKPETMTDRIARALRAEIIYGDMMQMANGLLGCKPDNLDSAEVIAAWLYRWSNNHDR